MAKTPKKASKKKLTFQPAVNQEGVNWRDPSAHWLKLDKARLAHWKAMIKGGNTIKTLAAWAKLLHVPRTKKAK